VDLGIQLPLQDPQELIARAEDVDHVQGGRDRDPSTAVGRRPRIGTIGV
jgi:hypothetical protein